MMKFAPPPCDDDEKSCCTAATMLTDSCSCYNDDSTTSIMMSDLDLYMEMIGGLDENLDLMDAYFELMKAQEEEEQQQQQQQDEQQQLEIISSQLIFDDDDDDDDFLLEDHDDDDDDDDCSTGSQDSVLLMEQQLDRLARILSDNDNDEGEDDEDDNEELSITFSNNNDEEEIVFFYEDDEDEDEDEDETSDDDDYEVCTSMMMMMEPQEAEMMMEVACDPRASDATTTKNYWSDQLDRVQKQERQEGSFNRSRLVDIVADVVSVLLISTIVVAIIKTCVVEYTRQQSKIIPFACLALGFVTYEIMKVHYSMIKIDLTTIPRSIIQNGLTRIIPKSIGHLLEDALYFANQSMKRCQSTRQQSLPSLFQLLCIQNIDCSRIS